jgi:hypothetical protein
MSETRRRRLGQGLLALALLVSSVLPFRQNETRPTYKNHVQIFMFSSKNASGKLHHHNFEKGEGNSEIHFRWWCFLILIMVQ